MRGDVPQVAGFFRGGLGFSPHARGCSEWAADVIGEIDVFPACAGMFRGPESSGGDKTSFPRMRGDVPWDSFKARLIAAFSPHARGCSLGTFTALDINSVFPACAGMFLNPFLHYPYQSSFPRMRGDVPVELRVPQGDSGFSPHARGCSAALHAIVAVVEVFPACAGMFPMGFQPEAR